MRSFDHLIDLQPLVGQTVGVSDWITVTQQRIQLFADATGDHQWIHLDVERAAKGPFGTTIAHGFLTLSLLPEMGASAFQVTADPFSSPVRSFTSNGTGGGVVSPTAPVFTYSIHAFATCSSGSHTESSSLPSYLAAGSASSVSTFASQAPF